MKVTNLGRAIGGGLALAAIALAALASPAAADPNPTTDFRTLAGVGSDTIQDVMNGLGTTITSGGAKVMASWDARGTATIQTKATGCTFNRPDGSGNGRLALRASAGESGGLFQGANVAGCVDFARSSSYGGGSTASTTGAYTYIPFAVDAVTFAENANTDLPSNLTFVQLQRAYRCLVSAFGGTPVSPLLMQAGSGTRSFWLGKMGVSEADITNGDVPCIDTMNNTIQEHDGTVLNGRLNAIVPFSIGQYIAQTNSPAILTQTGVTVTDRRGQAVLGRVNGLAPIVGGVLNTSFRTELVRDVYNVVPTIKLTDTLIAGTFVGSSSAICQQQSLIQLFGFGYRAATTDGLHAGCGYTNLRFDS